MDVFDDLDEKAKDLAVKARGALTEMKGELEVLAGDARKELAEFQTRAEAELRDVRSRVAAFIDPDRPASDDAPTDAAPAPDASAAGEAETGHS